MSVKGQAQKSGFLSMLDKIRPFYTSYYNVTLATQAALLWQIINLNNDLQYKTVQIIISKLGTFKISKIDCCK